METASQTSNVTGRTSPKQQFLDAYEREHAITMRVLQAYPPDKLELRPHPKCRTARELAWTFVLERGLGKMVFNNTFERDGMTGEMPKPPDSWDELLDALESAHRDFVTLIRSTPEDELYANVRFLTAPKTMGDVSRMEWIWFLLHDEIHHRGQFSIYLRMADGRVPSIYGPSADEPWM